MPLEYSEVLMTKKASCFVRRINQVRVQNAISECIEIDGNFNFMQVAPSTNNYLNDTV